MVEYSRVPLEIIDKKDLQINSFIDKSKSENIDWETVHSFGEEWTKFSSFTKNEIESIGQEYFDIVPLTILNKKGKVLDVGCGTGRWTKYICKKVGFVEAIDPSKAVISASKLLKGEENVRITMAEVSNLPFEKASFDLVFSLGVLHHIPDTKKAIIDCVEMVKPGGYFLVYLYYSLDNRGSLYKFLYWISDLIRNIISKLPKTVKKITCDLIAFTIYVPLIFFAKIIKNLLPNGEVLYKKLPLAYYVGKSLKVVKNDALDRFGTPLEQRFSKAEIKAMLKEAGLNDITFSSNAPFWHAIGKKSE